MQVAVDLGGDAEGGAEEFVLHLVLERGHGAEVQDGRADDGGDEDEDADEESLPAGGGRDGGGGGRCGGGGVGHGAW